MLVRALAILSARYGDNHGQSALVLDGLGFVYMRRHDCRRAMTFQRRAVAANEAVFGGEHPSVAETLTTLASCEVTVRDRAAIADAERALAIFAKFPAFDPYEQAGTRWTLAQALGALGGDRTRAATLARDARALYAKSPEPDAKDTVAEIDRWLSGSRSSR